MEQQILLTPGPLTTSVKVKEAMLQDVGTRDGYYQGITQDIRKRLLKIAHGDEVNHTCILLQGSGTYGVESVMTSTIQPHEKVLILSNGAYGERMEKICKKARVPYVIEQYPMIAALPLDKIEHAISQQDITHVAYIHCETTAGVMNDISAIQALIHKYNKISIVDAMSSFASMEISLTDLDIDYLITSSNKCLHGVPGIAIVFAKKASLEKCQNICTSLSLDLYEQYRFMEDNNGSFRFTSPTHVMLALLEALKELEKQGGIPARNLRYLYVQQEFHQAMKRHHFETLIDPAVQSPIITTYLYPDGFDFQAFYDFFKEHKFLLYNGKLPGIDAFRIGNIGNIQDENIEQFKQLLQQYEETRDER